MSNAPNTAAIQNTAPPPRELRIHSQPEFAQTTQMDANIANRLFDAAVYLAHTSQDNPDDETILSLFGWLVCAYQASRDEIRADTGPAHDDFLICGLGV